MNKNEISVPLWKQKSKEGKEYYKGSKKGIEINGKQYTATLFINQNKKSESSPDMNILLNEIKQEDIQNNIQVPQNTKTNYDDNKSDIQLTDKDIEETFNQETLQLPF